MDNSLVKILGIENRRSHEVSSGKPKISSLEVKKELAELAISR